MGTMHGSVPSSMQSKFMSSHPFGLWFINSLSPWDGKEIYNSAVECHLDTVKVIGSSLIIPKPNMSFFLF